MKLRTSPTMALATSSGVNCGLLALFARPYPEQFIWVVRDGTRRDRKAARNDG
jgi:hypothetical protein